MIVGALLDPHLGIVESVVDRARPDGTLEREMLVDYLTDALFRKLASTGPDGFALDVLSSADPIDLARAYATRALQGRMADDTAGSKETRTRPRPRRGDHRRAGAALARSR